MTPTDFHDMIQKILEATFPTSVIGTFLMSNSSPTVVNVGVPIRTLRIVGTLDVQTTWTYDSTTPNIQTRQKNGGSVETYDLPHSGNNSINSVGETSFTMGANGYGSSPCTYYVNE